MRRPTARKLRLRTSGGELLKHSCAFTGHPSDLLNRSAEAIELPLQIADHRVEAIADFAASIRKEEIAGGGSNTRTDQSPCCHSHSFVHTSSPTAVVCSKSSARGAGKAQGPRPKAQGPKGWSRNQGGGSRKQ